MTAVAAIPIVLALVLLVALRMPAIRAMPICAIVTTAVAYGLWQVPPKHILAASIEALWVTTSILQIIFGALFFLALLRHTGAIRVLQRTVGNLSGDARIQAILVGWSLGSFLEGAAGFGTPAAITAPLLIGLGFRPIQAVVIALIGDSTAVSFGAVGTPLLIGMGQGLTGADGSEAVAVQLIAEQIAAYDLVLGTIMPAVLVLALVLYEPQPVQQYRTTEPRATEPRATESTSIQPSRWRLGFNAVPFALAVGLAQAFTSWVVVQRLGPEFPNLIGSLAGLVAALVMLRTGWLVPRQEWRIQAEEQGGGAESADSVSEHIVESEQLEPTRVAAFAPYLLLIGILVLTRVQALPLGGWLSSVMLGMKDILGTGISSQFSPLYSPGAIFMVCALCSACWLRGGLGGVQLAARQATATTGQTAIALVAAVIMVRIFIHSGTNSAHLPSMPLALAEVLADNLGSYWLAVAPWIGALGSFVSGSATFSNMLFALMQMEVATELNYDPASVLGLQGVGAAAGNMTCIHNVVAACAVAGILGKEGEVIRRTALPMLAYLSFASLLGLLLSHESNSISTTTPL